MSDFDLFGEIDPEQPATLEEEKPSRAPRPPRSPDLAYNTIALFFVSATVGLCLFFAALIYRPDLPINPFPVPTVEPTPTLFLLDSVENGVGEVGEIAAPTATPTELPTATPTLEPTATALMQATDTPEATEEVPVAIPDGEAEYILLNETLTYMPHSGVEGCDYMAVAGQVFDVDGEPVTGVPIIIEGDEGFSALEFSGNAPQYGPAGYEFFISDTPYEAEFIVRLVSETGVSISESVVVRTSASCDENVVLVIFGQAEPTP